MKAEALYENSRYAVMEMCMALTIFRYIQSFPCDISYCIADIEDAVEKEILDVDKLCFLLIEEFNTTLTKFDLQPSNLDLKAIINKAKVDAKIEGNCQVSQFFICLRIGVLHPLVTHATDRFIANVDHVYQGDFNGALLEDHSHYHAITQTLKNVALKYVFCNKEVEARELQGYKIIIGLLDCYKPLLLLTRQQFNRVAAQEKSARLLDKRLYKKLPDKHLRAYFSAVGDSTTDEHEYYYRCRLFQDYISGMTDQFAYDEFRAMMISD